eukprot:6178429-Pleurochrysis_carterae.AAC.1
MLLCVASRVWRASRELRAQHGAARTQLNGLSLSRTSWTASSRLSCAPPPLLPSPPPSSSATPNSLASAALSSLIASSYASTEKQLAACTRAVPNAQKAASLNKQALQEHESDQFADMQGQA